MSVKPVLGFGGNHRNAGTTVFSFAFERNHAVGQGKKRMILAHAYIRARMVFGSALTYNDIAGGYGLSAEDFNAQAFAF